MAVLGSNGVTLAFNDNGSPAGCGTCSYLNYVNTQPIAVKVVIRNFCHPLRQAACSGTVAYRFADLPSRRLMAFRKLLDIVFNE
jgi:hypothetical protein